MAQSILPANDPWQIELKDARAYILTTLSDPKKRATPNISGQLRGRLENVKKLYMDRYLALHNQQRLNREQDTQKKQLVSDPRWARLRALSKLSILPSRQMEDVQAQFAEPDSLPQLTTPSVNMHAFCQQCNFQPANQQST